jgi:hypothetical protein
MAEITLSNGKRVIVDELDYLRVNKLHWYESSGVAVTSYRTDGALVVISMPRFILGLVPGDKRLVSHRNGNKLNCRRSNLEIKTRSASMLKSKTNSNNTSGYRGVSEVNGGYWRAQITISGMTHRIGTFKSAKEASEAYKAASKELNKLKEARNAKY